MQCALSDSFILPNAEHRGAAQVQAATPPCALAASQTLKGSFTEPGPAVTGYGALQTSVAVIDMGKPATHTAEVFQRPSTGRRGMPAASSATSIAMPDADASQNGALPGSAIPDSHREQPQLGEPVPARLVWAESQGEPPAPGTHGREAAPTDVGVPVPLMGTLPQAASLTDAGQPEATLLGIESGTSTLRQDTALLQTGEQALRQLSAVTAGDAASATAEHARSPDAAEQAPMATRNREAPEHSSADGVRSQVSTLPAGTEVPQTEQQAPGQDTRKVAEGSDSASGKPLYPTVQEAAATTSTVSAAVAQLPADDQLSKRPAQDAMMQMPLLDSVSGATGTDDWEHHSSSLQVALYTVPGALPARHHEISCSPSC